MLALKLMPQEWLDIGDKIKVMNIGGDEIQLAIEAPKEIAVIRSSAKVREPKPKQKYHYRS